MWQTRKQQSLVNPNKIAQVKLKSLVCQQYTGGTSYLLQVPLKSLTPLVTKADLQLETASHFARVSQQLKQPDYPHCSDCRSSSMRQTMMLLFIWGIRTPVRVRMTLMSGGSPPLNLAKYQVAEDHKESALPCCCTKLLTETIAIRQRPVAQEQCTKYTAIQLQGMLYTAGTAERCHSGSCPRQQE